MYDLVASFPRPDVFVPGYLARQYWYNGSFGSNEGYPWKYFDAQTKLSSVMFADILTRINSSDLALVEPSRSTCSDTTCRLAVNGQLLYMDGNHPTPFGASLILDQIMALGWVGLEKSTSDWLIGPLLLVFLAVTPPLVGSERRIMIAV